MIAWAWRRWAGWAALGTVIAGLAVLFGRWLPASESLLTRNRCALPCFYGIEPGISAAHAPEHVARSDPWGRGGARYSLSDPFGAAAAATFLTDVGFTHVTAVFVFPLRAKTVIGTLGDLLALHGAAQRVLFMCSRATQSIYITFGTAEAVAAEFRPAAGRLHPDLPIISLVLLDPARERAALEGYGCADSAAWLGFARWWRYTGG